MKRNKNQPQRPKKTRRSQKRAWRIAPRSTSIYFLLWATFSLLALVIVLLFGASQNIALKQAYRDEVSRSLAVSGKAIQKELANVSSSEDSPNYTFLIRSFAARYDVSVYILDGEGTVLFPEEEGVSEFDAKAERLKERLEAAQGKPVLYEDTSGEYVYGVKLSAFLNGEAADAYLYVSKSPQLFKKVAAQANTRTVFMSIFVLVLSFGLSGVVSGAVTKPIAELTDKAKQLAQGDFSVDFRGKTYVQEMDEFAETLNFACGELSKADQLQKELIANVSHDFKTPLTMIKAYASMIQEISGDNPEKRAKHTQVIIDEADRLTSLVNDLLDLSKIRSGINALELKTFNLSEFTAEALEKFDYLKERDGYSFFAEIEPNLYTRADEVKIGEVLYNLIGNAVNYTGDDKTVKVSLSKTEEGTVRFSVTDTGKGIKAEEITTIWDRYYRSGQSHKRPVQGTGLGLSIVKTILEKHNFRFGVESTVGKGSTFYVIFPYYSPASDTP